MSPAQTTFLLILLLCCSCGFLFLWLRSLIAYLKLQQRFKPALALEKETANLTRKKILLTKELRLLNTRYAEGFKIYKALKAEADLYKEEVDLAQLGLSSPSFHFSDSESFKKRIEEIRAAQKACLLSHRAILHDSSRKTQSSTAERTRIDHAMRLSLRAFNNECTALIGKVRWNTSAAAEKRILRSFTYINTLNKDLGIRLSEEFLALKCEELHLTHAYREKKKQEQEARAELARAQREEEILLKEVARAEKEERRAQKMLRKAQEKGAQLNPAQAAQYWEMLTALTESCEKARQKAERARSMAEQTRAGHIYIVSNVGSFGPGIYKIGMTRRLDPMDRVRELGNASVPFLFDIHTIVYTDDAPSLEKALHRAFDAHRVNKANSKKEFFQVPLEQIIAELQKFIPGIEFTTTIEAQEYHETCAKMGAIPSTEYIKFKNFQPVKKEFPEFL